MKGELAEGVLPGLLRKLFVERLSASLRLERGAVRRLLLFRNGQLVGLDGLAGDAGEDVVRAHVQGAVEDSLSWTDGTFALEELDPKAPPLSAANLRVTTGDLILATVRRVSARCVELGLGDTSRLLQLSTDPMLRFQRLSLTPEDGYVVSRTDGTFSAEELLAPNSFDRDQLRHSLYALLCTGVVEYVPGSSQRRAPPADRVAVRPSLPLPTPPPPAPTPAPAAPPRAAAAPTPLPARPVVRPRAAPPATPTPAPAPPPAVPTPPRPATPSPAVVAQARRVEIETAWSQLPGQNHFQVLGLERTATMAEVKDSYFKRARRFHPDAVAHDPALADLADKLEAVFIRLGESYEILKSPIARSSYEATLARLDPPKPAPSEPAAATASGPATAAETPVASRGPSLEDVVRLTTEVKKAERLLSENRWADAIEFLESLVHDLQGRLKSRAVVALATAYAHDAKGTRRAEKLLLGVLESDPRYVDAHLRLGRLYLASGLKARALASFRKAADLSPENEEALAVLAELAPAGAETETHDDKPAEGSGSLLRKLFKKG